MPQAPDTRPPVADAARDADGAPSATVEPTSREALRRSTSERLRASQANEDAATVARLDARLGAYTGAILCAAGCLLLVTQALPLAHKPPFWAHALLTGVAAILGLVLLVLARRDRANLNLLFGATFVAVGIIAVLVALSGAMRSVYAELYLFPVIHAAAFQTRRRLMVVLVVVSAAFLAPVAYHPGNPDFAAIALICMPPAVLAAAVLSVVTDAQRRQRAKIVAREVEARRLAENDALTGLGNYRMFWRHLDAEVARCRRHREVFSLVIMDLNGFKAINDEHGHQCGDQALRQVADALGEALRSEDVCCRQGGDEFAVIAVRAEEAEAEELAERLISAVAALEVPGAPDRRLGASAGWATFGRPATTADELILRADEALREAKRQRRRMGGIARAHEAGDPPPAGRHAVAVEDGHANGGTSPAGGEAPPSSNGSAARLVVLSGYARALSAARDERAIAETTVAHLMGAVDATTAMVLRCEGPEDPLRPLAAAGDGRASGPGASPGALARPVLRTARRERRSALATGEPTGDGPRSELAVPVLVDGEVWGCLLTQSDRPDAYTDADRDLAEGIATQMARALAWGRVLEQLSGTDFGELYRLTGGVQLTASESRRVIDLAWRVGRRLDFSPVALRSLYLAALFQDAGAVGVPAELTGKAGELSSAERAVLHEHPVIAERLLRPFPLLREAAGIIRSERERFDGAGYPDGLSGDRIPLPARVLLACQAWVAMTSPRPWRAQLDFSSAREELERAGGSQLDPRVVAALLSELDAERAESTVAPA